MANVDSRKFCERVFEAESDKEALKKLDWFRQELRAWSIASGVDPIAGCMRKHEAQSLVRIDQEEIITRLA